MPYRVALVTGAAQGIGRGIALRLANDGLDVAVNDLSTKIDLINSVCHEIQSKGRRSIVVSADVTVEDEVKGIVSTTVKELGSLDVMVANAGIAPLGSILEISAEEWDRTMTVNARSVFLCYKYAAQQMVKQGRSGRIIGASSLAGKKGHPLSSAYSASKFAVRGLTQSAAAELGKKDITVNAYAPGVIDTPMSQGTNSMIEKITGNSADLTGALWASSAVGKPGHPEDIANLVSFLASPECRYITGQTISIDGGIHFD